MECKISGGKLVTGQTVFEGMTEQPVDIDFALPDYCPDIGKVLRCIVAPSVTMRRIDGENIRLEGSARINVIYLDEREHSVSSCTHDYPFSASVKAGDIPQDGKIEAEVREDYFNCRAASPRRLGVHGSFTLAVKVTAPSAHDYIEDAQGDGIRAKRISRKVCSYVGCSQQSFSLGQDLELPDSKPAAACIIHASCEPICSESKAIANKLIVKGECLVRIVYRAENSRELECMEYTLPFSQFVDLTGVDDECRCVVHLETQSADISIRPDPDGEYRRFAAQIGLFADCKAYRPVEINAVCDAYSTEYELTAGRRQLTAQYVSDMIGQRATAALSVDLGEMDASRIECVWAAVSNMGAAVRGGNVRIAGKVTVYVIASDEQGTTELFEQSREFDCEAPVNASSEQCETAVESAVRGISYRMSGANRVEATVELEIKAAVMEKPALSCISSISVDKNMPKQISECPAVTLYFADAGEDLWDIARCCNSSVESIMRENSLEQETVTEPCRLLISM